MPVCRQEYDLERTPAALGEGRETDLSATLRQKKKPNLCHAVLSGINITGAVLSNLNLNMALADLRAANTAYSDMRGAN